MDLASARRNLSGSRFHTIRWFDEIDSTNRWLADEARQGAPDGLVAIAGVQHAGRGRLGRAWVAPSGSALLMSVLVRPGLPAEQAPLCSLAMGLAVRDAAAAWRVPAMLKWPNDVIIAMPPASPTDEDRDPGSDGAHALPYRKLAGILAEAVPSEQHRLAVVVGVGLNLTRPDDASHHAVLQQTAAWVNTEAGPGPGLIGPAVTIAMAAETALLAFEEAMRQAEQTPDAFIDHYRAGCSTIGQRVRVEFAAAPTLHGLACDVEPSGALVVQLDTGHRAVVHAGDVVHLRPVDPGVSTPGR